MRFVVAGIAYIAALAFIVVCCAANYFFWVHQGRDVFRVRRWALSRSLANFSCPSFRP